MQIHISSLKTNIAPENRNSSTCYMTNKKNKSHLWQFSILRWLDESSQGRRGLMWLPHWKRFLRMEYVQPEKLTWIHKIAIFERRYILKTIILGIYVRFRGGMVYGMRYAVYNPQKLIGNLQMDTCKRKFFWKQVPMYCNFQVPMYCGIERNTQYPYIGRINGHNYIQRHIW